MDGLRSVSSARSMETNAGHEAGEESGLIAARWLVVALVLLVCFTGVFDHDLWNPHEHRVGGMIREMADSEDYLVPHLGGRPLFHKPPLYYATGAALLTLLPTEPARTVRLTTLLYSLLAVAATARLGRLLGGRRVALAGTLVFVTTLGFVHTSHLVLVDAGLVAFTTGAFWAFVECRRGRVAARWIFWIALGGAFLTKGFVGPALVVPAVLLYLLAERDLPGGIRALAPLRGLTLFATVLALWAVPLYFRDAGQSLWAWLRDENVGRFFSEETLSYHHDEPLFFYVPGLLLMFFPWILWLLVGSWRRLRGTTGGSPELERLSVIWFVAGFLLLTLSRTKREIYLVPVLPALSLLVADWLVRIRHLPGRRTWTVTFGAVVILAVPVCAALGLAGRLTYPLPWLSFPLAIAVALSTWLLIRRRGGTAFWLTPAMVFVQVTVLIFPPADVAKSHREGMLRVAEAIASREVASWRIGESLQGSLSFEIDVQAADMRRAKDLREYLAAEGDGRLLVRVDRWPFARPPGTGFPGYVTRIRISARESLVVLRPTAEAVPLVTKRGARKAVE